MLRVRKNIMSQAKTQKDQPGRVMRMMQWIMPRITPVHVRMYRWLGGRFVNRATAGMPVLLLTTTGRRTGKLRTVAVGHMREGDDVIVAGTNGGLPPVPAWVLNLRARPEADVQIDRERFHARAEFMERRDRDEHWRRLVAAYPIYDQARRFAGREIPLIRLRKMADEKR
jgi:deazaflavin-dependent oxidoreductase (nitroreductase family)